jgi:UDP-2-acetamido-3-amino-2,3-dideoxy-glucuronate N-acetyltransferase
VPDYALMMGVPARRVAWMSRHGHRMLTAGGDGVMVCPESGYRYRESDGAVRCVDLDEDIALPADNAVGKITYDDFKRRTS